MLVMWDEKDCKRSFQSLNVFCSFLQCGETLSERNCILYAGMTQPPSTSLLQSCPSYKKHQTVALPKERAGLGRKP